MSHLKVIWMEDDVACLEIMPTFCVEELRNAR